MITLKRFEEEDVLELLAELKNTDIRFLYKFAGVNYRFPLDDKQLKQTMDNKSNLLFKVIDIKGNNVGHCQILRLDLQNHSASIGRLLIYSKYRNKGFGKLMIQKLLKLAKDNLGLKDISLRVFEFNISAIKCYEVIGFRIVSEELIDIPNISERWKIITMVLSL